MKAIVQRGYGEPGVVLGPGDVDRPAAPGGTRVLLRVHASSVNPADWFTVTGRPYVLRLAFGLRGPRQPVPGKDVAGVVEAVGPGVTRFRPGDEVYGELPGGACAEYALAAENALAPKPAGLTFAEAAAVPLAGVAALQAVRDAAGVRDGQHVLVNGASGGVGTFAVQIAKALGARVTGVCSTRNLDLVRSLGADEALDYTREDFTRTGQRYDAVVDLVGNHTPPACRRALRRGGVYVAASGRPGGPVLGPLPRLGRVALSSLRGGARMKPFAAKAGADGLSALTELIESGAVRPVIDRAYDLADLASALTRQGAGHARGKTVITVRP
jgi:NADPH:quinone reductase-like Zn-dependent oxidoreductase